MKKIPSACYLLLLTLIAFYSCQNKAQNQAKEKENTSTTQTEKQNTPPQLKKYWASDPYLETSESVLYNPWDNTLFVSCIYGKPTDKDGNGLIFKISIENGQTIQERFAKDLNAPKGMGLSPDTMTLYVTDIDRLVLVHARSGIILKSYPIQGAKFLNDVFVDPTDSTVYFSDTETGKIHRLKGEEISVLTRVKAPNGITAYNDSTLLVLSFAGQEMYLIDKRSGKVNTVPEGIPNGDGIVPDGQGGFFASDWSGQIFHLDQDLHPSLLLDTRKKEINAADIEYVPQQQLLLVPTFFKNDVTAYKYE